MAVSPDNSSFTFAPDFFSRAKQRKSLRVSDREFTGRWLVQKKKKKKRKREREKEQDLHKG